MPLKPVNNQVENRCGWLRGSSSVGYGSQYFGYERLSVCAVRWACAWLCVYSSVGVRGVGGRTVLGGGVKECVCARAVAFNVFPQQIDSKGATFLSPCGDLWRWGQVYVLCRNGTLYRMCVTTMQTNLLYQCFILAAGWFLPLLYHSCAVAQSSLSLSFCPRSQNAAAGLIWKITSLFCITRLDLMYALQQQWLNSFCLPQSFTWRFSHRSFKGHAILVLFAFGCKGLYSINFFTCMFKMLLKALWCCLFLMVNVEKRCLEM